MDAVVALPFPPSKQGVRMRYGYQFGLQTAAVQSQFGAQKQFQLNSPYQPDAAGATIQPYGWDTWASVYTSYTCTGCEMRIRLLSYDTTIPDAAVTMIITPSPTLPTLTGTQFNVWQDRPFVHSVLMSAEGNAEARDVRQRIDLPRFEGKTRALYLADDDYQSAVSATPVKVPMLTMAATNNASAAQGYVQVLIELVFEVNFWERKLLPQS